MYLYSYQRYAPGGIFQDSRATRDAEQGRQFTAPKSHGVERKSLRQSRRHLCLVIAIFVSFFAGFEKTRGSEHPAGTEIAAGG